MHMQAFSRSSWNQAAEKEVTISQQMQTVLSNHRLLLQQSITQNASLRERLQQISALAAGVPQAPPPVDMPQTPLMARTPLDHGSYSSSRVKRYDSFMSVRSTFSESFYDAQEQVLSPVCVAVIQLRVFIVCVNSCVVVLTTR